MRQPVRQIDLLVEPNKSCPAPEPQGSSSGRASEPLWPPRPICPAPFSGVVIHVHIITDFQVLTRALTELVTSLGFTAHTEDGPEVEVALTYLTRTAPPYPAPAGVPTLALFSGSEDEVIRLLQRGYRGYLGPTDPLSRLKLALEALRRGEIWASRELLTRTLGTLAAPSLTEREQEVLQLLAGGLSNRTIAERLGISERTVKAHVSNLFDKHGVQNRTGLALLV